MTLDEARKIIASEAGRANLAKHGKEFYKEISRKGVEARKLKKRNINPETQK